MKSRTLLTIVLLSAYVFLVHSIKIKDLIKDEWEVYKTQNAKVYKNEVEDGFRMKIYLENRQRIAKYNKKANNQQLKFKLTMNKFGDLLPHEFKSLMNGYRMDLKRNSTKSRNRIGFLSPKNFKAPENIDWRSDGYVTPVKNQGQCGSCWAFSATGSLEGQHKRITGDLVSLSEQNLVDCSTSEGNKGCHGGSMDLAFRYVQKNHGIDTEDSYPYEGKDDNCRFSQADVGADDKGFIDIPSGDEQALMDAVASVGPISVAIDASHESFQFYKSGIYFEEECSSTDLDHGVLVVGYGTEEEQDYWLVKNSWGDDWGEGGYIKMARNRDNQCGIATQASYPIA